MERSDEELVKAACSGDIDSFRELYERHYHMAVGVAYSRLSDKHLAEDAAQEAFAVACRRLSSLRLGNRFPEWLKTICRRTASRMARLQRSNRSVEPECMTSFPAKEKDGAGDCVHQALEQISTSQREIVFLHYFSGLSYKDIAEALGTTTQAVHGRLQRARRELAHQLRQMNERGVI